MRKQQHVAPSARLEYMLLCRGKPGTRQDTHVKQQNKLRECVSAVGISRVWGGSVASGDASNPREFPFSVRVNFFYCFRLSMLPPKHCSDLFPILGRRLSKWEFPYYSSIIYIQYTAVWATFVRGHRGPRNYRDFFSCLPPATHSPVVLTSNYRGDTGNKCQSLLRFFNSAKEQAHTHTHLFARDLQRRAGHRSTRYIRLLTNSTPVPVVELYTPSVQAGSCRPSYLKLFSSSW